MISGKHFTIIATLLVGFVAGCGEKAQVQEKKIGYIDSAVIMNEYDLAVKARNELQLTAGQMQADVQKIENELKAMQEAFVAQGATLPMALQVQKRNELAAKEQEYIQFVQMSNQRASQLEQEKLGPVFEALNTQVEAYGKANGYYLILGATPGGSIVFADSTANLTKPILEFMRKGQK